MSKQVVNNISNAVPPLPTTSQVVILNKTVYVSGSIGYDHEYNIVCGIQGQTKAALDNLKVLLEGVGSGLEHVVKVNVYLTHLGRDFQVFDDVYIQYFPDPEKLPVRTTVGVAALPLGAFVEVDAIAELPIGV